MTQVSPTATERTRVTRPCNLKQCTDHAALLAKRRPHRKQPCIVSVVVACASLHNCRSFKSMRICRCHAYHSTRLRVCSMLWVIALLRMLLQIPFTCINCNQGCQSSRGSTLGAARQHCRCSQSKSCAMSPSQLAVIVNKGPHILVSLYHEVMQVTESCNDHQCSCIRYL